MAEYKLKVFRKSGDAGASALEGGGTTPSKGTSVDNSQSGVASHTHKNLGTLEKISVDERDYVYLEQLRESEDGGSWDYKAEKARAGFADEADKSKEADHATAADEAKIAEDSKKWASKEFDDYLDQSLRRGDDVTFRSVRTSDLESAGGFEDGTTGSGFKIWQDRNGVSYLTIDKLTVRQTMTVMELLVEKIRAIGGRFIVSAANGQIASVSEDGDNYIIFFEQDNTFVAHDLMRCAVMSGTKQRSYWVEIEEASTDSVRVAKSEFDGVVPKEGDEVVLMGNTTNKLRQNLISIAATEDGQPRIDVMDGVRGKNFTGCLRVRLGNLEGISDDAFGADSQPRGNGLYADNAYLKGTFLLSTGEDVKTKFSIMEGKLESAIEGLRTDMATDKGYLDNPTFDKGMDSWATDNDASLFALGNRWIWANNAPQSKKTNYASVETEDGRKCLFLRSRYIMQKNADFKNLPEFTSMNVDGEKQAEAVYLSFLYKCTKAGRLKIDFEGVDKTGFEKFSTFAVDEEIGATDGFVGFGRDGLWNGTGDFRLSFTGEIYVCMLILSQDRVNALAYKYKTLFEQSEKLIKIAAGSFDKDGNVLEESSILTTAKYNELISKRFNTDGTLINTSGLLTTAEYNKLVSERFNDNGTLRNTGGLVTTTDFVAYKQTITDAGYVNKDGVLDMIQGKIDSGDIVGVESFAGMFATAVDEAGLVKEASMSVYVTKTEAGEMVSNASIRADKVVIDGSVTINDAFNVDTNGNLETNNIKLRGYSYQKFVNLSDSGATKVEIAYQGRSFVCWKLNKVLCVNGTFNNVMLPLGDEYEGARVVIVDMPWLTGNGQTNVMCEDLAPIYSGLYARRDEHRPTHSLVLDKNYYDATLLSPRGGTIELCQMKTKEAVDETATIIEYRTVNRWVIISNTCRALYWEARVNEVTINGTVVNGENKIGENIY